MKIGVEQLWNQDAWKVIPTSLTLKWHWANVGWRRAWLASFQSGPACWVAKHYRDHYPATHPSLAHLYGDWLYTYADRVKTDTTFSPLFFVSSYRLILMPIRFATYNRPNLPLIKRGLAELAKLEGPIAVPLFGCGLGEFGAHRMLNLLTGTLPDNFTLCIHSNQIGIRSTFGKRRYILTNAPLEITGGPERMA